METVRESTDVTVTQLLLMMMRLALMSGVDAE